MNIKAYHTVKDNISGTVFCQGCVFAPFDIQNFQMSHFEFSGNLHLFLYVFITCDKSVVPCFIGTVLRTQDICSLL